MKQTRSIVVTLSRESVHRGPLILVNREHPLHSAVPENSLAEVAPGVRIERRAALLYEAAMREVGGNAQIVAVSGYRSHPEQERLFAGALAEHGEHYTHSYVAFPGCSEHQSGLAIDVGRAGQPLDFIAPDFPYSGICQAFRSTVVKHGFIQRYPAGKEQITGIGHEPWHFRYVGIPHSELMTELGFTLEEYVQWVKAFPLARAPYHYAARGRAYDIGYVPAGPALTQITLHGEPYTISGNNIDGFIAAVWRDAT